MENEFFRSLTRNRRHYRIPAAVMVMASLFHAAPAGIASHVASDGDKNPTVATQPATAGLTDPMFQQPYIDMDEWRDVPVRHHYVHGGFKGTDTRFSFYFLEKRRYQGRFFQHITPVPDNENLAQKAGPGEENKIGFAFESGAYFVETNGGGANNIGVGDPTITAYRANAAAAEYSRVLATKTYGPHRPYGYAYGGSGGGYYPIIQMIDPKYFADFWTLPGYLGANPPASLLQARIRYETTVAGLVSAREAMNAGIVLRQANGDVDTAFLGPGGDVQKTVAFHLSSPAPATNFRGGDLLIKSGDAAGKSLQIREVSGDMVILGSNDPALVSRVRPGDKVVLDTSNFLAAQTYHRHQVPGRDFPVWDQFRKLDGTPLYPQRPVLIGPILVQATAGSLETGKIHGKMIVVSSLWDREAFPWQADWYRKRVEQQMGDQFDDSFRLWYTDHALHGDEMHQEYPTRTVSYLGVLHQALRDLTGWVEKGVPPPVSTNYKVIDGQVIVPENAAERGGIQPVVSLRVNGNSIVRVPVGTAVRFEALADVPKNTGKIVEARLDMDGAGSFPITGEIVPVSEGKVKVSTLYRFDKAGTYFPTIRVVSQRHADGQTPYARIQNLARVRVEVHEKPGS